MKVHQFSAGFNEGDAISNLMIYLKNRFLEKNIPCEIYSQNIGYSTGKLCKKFTSYRYSKGDIIIYHHSIHSKVFDFIKSISGSPTTVLIYHNVTPAEYIISYDLTLAYYLQKGRDELSLMISFFTYNFAVSNFNKNELLQIGFKNINVLPIPLNLSLLTKKNKTNKEEFSIVFVGRIAPNKKQTDLIKIAKILVNYNFPFKLTLAGKTARELESYKYELDTLIKYFNLDKNVEFVDCLDQDCLSNVYSNADLFLSMSEHEGFCVPLLEAMYYKIPIMAYNSSAISETLGNGGILINEKKYEYIAELIYTIQTNPSMKNKLLKMAENRFAHFSSIDSFQILFDRIS
jgi:glycosyltransferase involved in cell wall biosynthesis